MPHRNHLPAQLVAVIKTEIQTGRTLARVASKANHPNTRARNTANARKAYDTARKWAEKALLTPADSEDIADQLQLLKADLAKLENRSKASSKRSRAE